jgi:hypothetical protein
MTHFSVLYEEIEVIKIIIRVPSSSLSLFVCYVSSLPSQFPFFFVFKKHELVYDLCP